ncbi:hypothetical protein K0M31_013938 [Melipona bicolor]|uniref:Uncharacterized protein n=1 Tax=Melipona bicolor TaxID=60889 RepID=A0AA40KTN5_9HYME|nr:hypothetical protein K0M31_013938 [Melipona bicolor]
MNAEEWDKDGRRKRLLGRRKRAAEQGWRDGEGDGQSKDEGTSKGGRWGKRELIRRKERREAHRRWTLRTFRAAI